MGLDVELLCNMSILDGDVMRWKTKFSPQYKLHVENYEIEN